MPLHVSSHPLVADCLAGLRDATTPPDEFRVLSNKIINMLVYEATRELPTRRGTVRTPLREAETTSCSYSAFRYLNARAPGRL